MNIVESIAQQACTCGFLLEGKEPVSIKHVPVVYPDRPGVNRNVYPKEELIKAIRYYKQLIQVDPTYRYCLAKHPKDTSEEWIGLIAGVIDDIYFNEETNRVEMDVTLLPTIWGHFIAWALKNGYVIGTSLRGDAKKEPGTFQLGDEVINVYIRRDLKLEGVDFVLYPSFITTHAEQGNLESVYEKADIVPYEHVVESYVKSLTDVEDRDRIMATLLRKSNSQVLENTGRRSEMDKMELEVLQAKRDKLELETRVLEDRKTTVEQHIEQLQKQLDSLEEQVKSLTAEVEQKTAALSTLTQTEKVKEQKVTELEQQIKALEEKIEALSATKAQIEEELKVLEKRGEAEVRVRFGGKTFTQDNPPKVRIVPVSEKVSSTSWGNIDKDKLRKLVWLTGSKEIAEKVFGLVEGMDDWRQLKYPVYEPMKSSEEGYDIDLVLNRDGLATAVAFVFGRPGWALTAKEKKQLIRFLYEKYKALKKEGIADIPPKLEQAAKRVGVLEKIEVKDEKIAPLVEFALLAGLVDVEGIEDVEEKIEVEIDDAALAVLADAIVKILSSGEYEEVVEQIDVESLPKGDAVLLKILKKEDGTPTSFAEKYEITGADEFEDKYVDSFCAAVDGKEYGEVVRKVQDATYGYLEGMLDNAEDVKAFLDPFFDFLASAVETEKTEGEETEEETPTATPEEEQTPAPEETGGGTAAGEEQPTTEQKDVSADSEEDTSGGDDMLYEKLKEMVESRFENVSIESPEDLIKFVEKLASDYAEAYAQLHQLELEKVKEQKIAELEKAGVERAVIEEEFDGIESVEELEVIAEKLLKIVSKVQESRKHTAIDPLQLRKGVGVDKTSGTDDSVDMFNKLMKSV